MDGEQLRAELVEARNDREQKAAAVAALTVQVSGGAATYLESTVFKHRCR